MNKDLYEFYERYGHLDNRRCLICGHLNRPQSNYCSKCGYKLNKEIKFGYGAG